MFLKKKLKKIKFRKTKNFAKLTVSIFHYRKSETYKKKKKKR
jgi:hypothetical protein